MGPWGKQSAGGGPTLDSVLPRKTLAALLVRSLPEGLPVTLWRSMNIVNPGPRGKRIRLSTKGIAVDWVRVLASRVGIPGEMAKLNVPKFVMMRPGCFATKWRIESIMAW